MLEHPATDEAGAVILDEKNTPVLVTLAEASVRLHCRNAKWIFGNCEHGAVGRDLLLRSPFERLSSAAVAAEMDRYITPEEAAEILEQLPSDQWRALFGLARFAGLRCTSETHTIRWGDIDLDRRRIRVHAPKTETVREVPIFPALYPLLQDAYDAAPERSEFVIPFPVTLNLPHVLKAAAARAGVPEWEDQFQTLLRDRSPPALPRARRRRLDGAFRQRGPQAPRDGPGRGFRACRHARRSCR